MRKVLGAQRIQLIKQFLGESILLSFLALIMGIALAELFLPDFNALAGKKLVLDYHNSGVTLLGLLGLGLFVGIFSGSYPAFYLSAYRPAEVLKGQRKASSGKVTFRRMLVIAQFSISILLIICELVITQQLRYMKNHELGFNPENVVVIPTNTTELTDPLRKIEAYVNAIHAQKEGIGILSTAISENVPGHYFQNKFGVIPENWEGQGSLEMVVTSMDENFLATYQMQLVEGRNFSREFSTDKNDAVLLNEMAVKRMGWDTALGKQFKYVHGDGPFTVIGVVKDIHFKSLQNKIEPLIYRFATEKYQMGFLSVRIRPENITEALPFLREQWQYIVPDVPFEYFFLADKFAQSYQEEEKVVEIIGLFSLLAILLACLGLLGLAALTVTQRTKEIGIRKVLGASVFNIVLLVSKQFVKLVLLANIIAWPIAYFVMKDWLQNYPYRINVGVSFFLLGGVLALLIALLTVSFQAIKAALANPVEALRYE
jgi:putative ABC transport system permease protein